MLLKSDEVKDLFSALAKAQGKFPQIVKNKTAKVESRRTGQRFEYSYADLADVLRAVQGPLADQGLSVSQPTQLDEKGNVNLVTMLLHNSGQFLGSTFPLEHCASPQDWGTQLTYMRRYSLTALLGIAADEDKDGKLEEEPASTALTPEQGQSPTRVLARAPEQAPAQRGGPPEPGEDREEDPQGDFTDATPQRLTLEGNPDPVPFRKALKELNEAAKAAGWQKADWEAFVKQTAGIMNLHHLGAVHLPVLRAAMKQTVPPSLPDEKPAPSAVAGGAR